MDWRCGFQDGQVGISADQARIRDDRQNEEHDIILVPALYGTLRHRLGQLDDLGVGQEILQQGGSVRCGKAELGVSEDTEQFGGGLFANDGHE